VFRLSPLYESAPVGGPPQPAFVNAALAVRFAGPLEVLLEELQRIENQLGRERSKRWGPRTVDLDILWAGQRTSTTSSLTVPHEQLTNRSFALRPLLDIFPEACDPRDGTRYTPILGGLEHQQIAQIDDENWWKRSPG
jgi:2-amino-4-hydroxy-6-hydroxymethyldihydropteridine diphosphokinase